MDTNMAQALKLAGGILVALVLISGLTIMFGKLSPSQNTLEDIKAFEQTIAFNKEFEVYDKDIMYGLDVISAINKAASYNKTYIDEYGYTEDLERNYLVNIILEDDIDLEQSIELYRIDSRTAREIPIDCANITDHDDIEAICDKLEIEEGDFRDLSNDTLSSGDLIDEARRDELYVRQEIYDLIIEPSSEQLKKTAINNENPEVWSKAILETYVYNFKSKKFRCVGVRYSEITQRITELTFAEI